jgi:hypothetical protein
MADDWLWIPVFAGETGHIGPWRRRVRDPFRTKQRNLAGRKGVKTNMNRGWMMLGAAWGGVVAIALWSCANNPSSARPEPILKLIIQMKGPIDTKNNIRYYVVFNTATSADAPGVSSASAEAASNAGVLPAVGVQAGPRAYGPFQFDKPKNGWDLPFYLSGGATGDPRRTISFTGTTPLLPVTWTDYFVLTPEFGTLQMIHGQHPQPLSNPTLIVPTAGTLLQNQDWFISSGNQLTILIRLSSLLNGSVYNQNTTASPVPGGVTVTPGAGSVVQANLITATTQGAIIDRWTLSDTDIGFTISTTPNAQTQDQHFRPTVLNPGNIPPAVSDDAVNFSVYQAQIR